MRTSRPSTRMRPASGCTMPARMPISVDFPAPFSPSRQWTSPRRSANEMSSLARTPGKDLQMPSNSTAGVCSEVGASRVGSGWAGGTGWLSRARAPGSLVQQGRHLALGGGVGNADLAALDAALRGHDLRPHAGRDVARLQQRDAAVGERQVVALLTERAILDLLDERLVGRGEVPQHR